MTKPQWYDDAGITNKLVASVLGFFVISFIGGFCVVVVLMLAIWGTGK